MKSMDARMEQDSVLKVFLRYLIPSLTGMLLMSVNIVMDGIFVGHRLGGVALAGINIAVPVFSIFTAISLWIGIGGATQYSFALGEKNVTKAQQIFTRSVILVITITIMLAIIAFIFRVPLAYLLGANDETLPYVMDYMNVLLLFGFVLTLENILSIFVRNDGDPNLAMFALIATAVINVILNYLFLFVFNLGVRGSALATMSAIAIGVLILCTHFFKKSSHLKLAKSRVTGKSIKRTLSIGLPSFLSELGMSVFTMGYNIAIAAVAGTAGVAAFSVLNYTHSVILMLFLGMGSAIQPLISYYRGAKMKSRETATIRLSVSVAFGTGLVFFIAGLLFADNIVNLFGDFESGIHDLAVLGVRVFFSGYLFMGFNFVMMTYFQTTDRIGMATFITVARELILMVIFLLVLPPLLGATGVFIAIPISEFIVATSIFIYAYKKHVFQN
ncbi:MATE family efflux transporter [Listeria fleischmannii]|uniref:Multidrug export protein MepA n=1 Tax=Listeria fleischmannii TaxID=1069827 RepID=A0A841YDL6_9LIST|nr:MATE family efflux transporter [Listeria fleischmannii]MBC1398356.1 MATE family efflux transporter [Listeria fleischmannii]MBC1426417.1 MATE family efflux transporter [Listeria fleischmannii]STY35687.1 Multidrug export protein mepA [Listeria fleischmannii subsp. coloradonensis]